jgi:hypothetical protein
LILGRRIDGPVLNRVALVSLVQYLNSIPAYCTTSGRSMQLLQCTNGQTKRPLQVSAVDAGFISIMSHLAKTTRMHLMTHPSSSRRPSHLLHDRVWAPQRGSWLRCGLGCAFEVAALSSPPRVEPYINKKVTSPPSFQNLLGKPKGTQNYTSRHFPRHSCV